MVAGETITYISDCLGFRLWWQRILCFSSMVGSWELCNQLGGGTGEWLMASIVGCTLADATQIEAFSSPCACLAVMVQGWF
jgi:hypothetical protein